MVNIYSKSPNRPLSLHDFKPKCVHSCHHVQIYWTSAPMGEGRAKNVASPFHQMPVWGEVVNLNTSGGKNEDFEKNTAFLKNA